VVSCPGAQAAVSGPSDVPWRSPSFFPFAFLTSVQLRARRLPSRRHGVNKHKPSGAAGSPWRPETFRTPSVALATRTTPLPRPHDCHSCISSRRFSPGCHVRCPEDEVCERFFPSACLSVASSGHEPRNPRRPKLVACSALSHIRVTRCCTQRCPSVPPLEWVFSTSVSPFFFLNVYVFLSSPR
jgi:hypothetical protein